MLKSWFSTPWVDKLRDRRLRAYIGGTCLLFLFAFLAYRACLSNAGRHRHRPGGGVPYPVGPHAATGLPCNQQIGPSFDQLIRVAAPVGMLEGSVVKLFGREIVQFLGVPYATPPVGDRRFKRTLPVMPWSGVRPAHRYQAHCAQYFFMSLVETVQPLHENMSEDCLYLNIWSPRSVSVPWANDAGGKTVMLFIHGGGFIMGSALLEETVGDALAAVGDVVVVTVNIRVGIYGFLDLDMDDITGNQQLYDINMALLWVQENIVAFGGDPGKVR